MTDRLARRRWLSARALWLHVALVVVAGGCLVAAWWQIGRARAGNALSYAYALEWPTFAVIAVIAWWHLVHDDDPEKIRAREAERATAEEARKERTVERRRDEESPELRAYNDYLARLAATGGHKTWRNPRGV